MRVYNTQSHSFICGSPNFAAGLEPVLKCLHTYFLYETTCQPGVKFFQCAENIGFNREKSTEEILSQTISSRIPTLGTAFVPRSSLQPTP